MGQVMRFDVTRRRAEKPLPVALTTALAVCWFECSAAWWRWVLTGR